jgi:hypothetical protein
MKQPRPERPNPSGPLLPSMVREHISQFPEHIRQNTTDLSRYTYLSIIRYFMGDYWIDRYVMPETAKRKSHLYPRFDTMDERLAWFIDIMIIADTLFNLQTIPGFQHKLDRMYAGDISATMSELIAGMLLKQNGWIFQFIEPINKLGADFDLAVMYSSERFAMIEVERKDRNTARRKKTVLYSLNHALRQLPQNQPGIIFVHIPQEWLETINSEVSVTSDLIDAVSEFMRNVTRVVMVAYFATYARLGDRDRLLVDHAHIQFLNQNSPFLSNHSWVLLNVSNAGVRSSGYWFPVWTFVTDEQNTGAKRPSNSVTDD